MRCIDWVGRAGLVGLTALAGCSGSSDRAPGETGSGSAAVRPAATVATPREPAQRPAPPEPPVPSADAPRAPQSVVPLPAPRAVRNWNEVRLQAAQRIVSANPGATYAGKVPDALLAIPVLEIELNGDGSVRKIEVLRPPRQAKDTVKLATDAVRRAAPFGDVSRLPRPWKFVETFLFDDQRKFKPRTLDQ